VTSLAAPTTSLQTRRVLRFATISLLLSVTVLERFGVTAGTLSASAALLAIYPFLVVAGVAGALSLSLERTLLYVACLAIALASTLVNESDASVSSLALVAVMYLPFVFVLRDGSLAENDAGWIHGKFLDLAALCAVIGIVQFGAQLLIHADWLFDFTRYIPTPLRASGLFNTVIPIGSLNKSNGFFFREPSGFSYLMALGLIAECVSLKRPLRVACLGLALLLTYSGTGILALLIASLHPFGAKTVLRLAIIACAFALVFWLFGDALNLSFTLGRVGEFNSESSSGYIRYIAPMRLVWETLGQTSFTAWLGHGPGTILRTARSYEFHDPTWAKLLFEYGVLGFVAFLSLFLVTLRRRTLPLQLRAALFWGWLIMGGHLLSPEQNFLTLVLVGLTPAGSALVGAARRQTGPIPLPLRAPALSI
jgi:hypothetical protein